MPRNSEHLRALPSVDVVLRTADAAAALDAYGRPATVTAVRAVIEEARRALASGEGAPPDASRIAAAAAARLSLQQQPRVRSVFNLSGTVLHTNLGRAVLADAAVEAAITAMRHAVALEFNLADGKRGERDALVRDLLCELTGAEDATVVNNNAAAVLLVLNSLANGREAIVSRGELIEIGGAFRMPDIMRRAGTRMVEVGTTNRTHAKDYRDALGPKSGVVLKVHTSNYRIEGFTKEVLARDLAAITREHGVPLVNDLGSGTLIDLERFGLEHEPTVAQAVADGADLVTFSGDKLLGGPQAGLIVGRKELVSKLNRNPMKRALRVDKIRLAALEATLRLYRDPDRLAGRLPTMGLLARPKADIEAAAARMLEHVRHAVGESFFVEAVACVSQIGSGALPTATLASAGIAIRPVKGRGGSIAILADALRRLPVPIIGRMESGSLVLDLRCLTDEAAFVKDLGSLRVAS
jgi:L-seryl-tRNA(Ser) seleniumtransferase